MKKLKTQHEGIKKVIVIFPLILLFGFFLSKTALLRSFPTLFRQTVIVAVDLLIIWYFDFIGQWIMPKVERICRPLRNILSKREYLPQALLILNIALYFLLIYFLPANTKINLNNVSSIKSNQEATTLLVKPVIHKVSPASALQGSLVTITGRYFGDEMSPNIIKKNVVFKDKNLLIKKWKDNEIQAEVTVEAPIGRYDLYISRLIEKEHKRTVVVSNSVKFQRLNPNAKDPFGRIIRRLKNLLHIPW